MLVCVTDADTCEQNCVRLKRGVKLIIRLGGEDS